MKRITIILGISIFLLVVFWKFQHHSAPAPSSRKLGTEANKLQRNFACPSPKVVGYYQDKVGGFRNQRLDWNVDNINMSVGLNLRFSQAALLAVQNDLTCNYEWPNPNGTGTWIVVTVHLIPNAALRVHTIGKPWAHEGTSKICRSHNTADCQFKLKRRVQN
jgi:hypothetical protein